MELKKKEVELLLSCIHWQKTYLETLEHRMMVLAEVCKDPTDYERQIEWTRQKIETLEQIEKKLKKKEN